jgi:hypothetical protein
MLAHAADVLQCGGLAGKLAKPRPAGVRGNFQTELHGLGQLIGRSQLGGVWNWCAQLTFILWTLAFCDEAMEKFVAAKALDAIVLQVAAAPREKVVRVALEALQVSRFTLNGPREQETKTTVPLPRTCSAR